jgi:hypothetical protein
MKSCQNFSQRTHPIHPIGHKTHVSSHFILFLCIWDCSVVLQNSVQNRPSWCKSLCHEVASEFFTTNAPNPPHWTVNSCFGVFRTTWMHLGRFGCLTKLSAKRAEVVEKSVPRSRVIIFRNEHTELTPWDLNSIQPLEPNLMFRCVSNYLGAFGRVWLRYNTQCKMGQPGAKVHTTKSRRNFL